MNPTQPIQIRDRIESFEFCESELIIGLAYTVGTDYKPVLTCLEEILRKHEYAPNAIRISDLIKSSTNELNENATEVERIESLMNAGNAICRDTNRNDIWALAAIAEINKRRGDDSLKQGPMKRTAHLILSLKRPEEVTTLRKVYGEGFYLIGVFATENERLEHLIEKDAPKHRALSLIERDKEERKNDYGQKTSKTFQLADVFVQLKREAFNVELVRFFSLIFSDPYQTPTQHEHAMFLAYASSMRSGQLGRQVGAAISTKEGDIISLGCNDVPKVGGGLYWPGKGDNRDHILGFDTNDRRIESITSDLLSKLPKLESDLETTVRKAFREVLDITEYGRAVHAEMDALLGCARSGVSPKGTILYTTTFPCHNCTRHLIAAGIERVFYIEPYAKSKAEELHSDAIVVEEKSLKGTRGPNRKLPFTHFVGVGPRRYFDLFSLYLSSGHELIRKSKGIKLDLEGASSLPRVPLSPFTYIQREQMAIELLERSQEAMDSATPDE